MEPALSSSDEVDPRSLASAGPFPTVDGVLDRALALVEYLREHCPWDRKQTAESLVPHLLEETHEAVDAIRRDDARALESELGDLLLNLAFQVVVAEQAGRFDRDGVVRALEAKMVRRHPHLFGLGEAESWEAIKARERAAAEVHRNRIAGEDAEGPRPLLEGIPTDLAPLLRAHRMQERASGVGFDWEDPSGAVTKVREELAEVEAALERGDDKEIQDEVGDLLFAVVNLARLARAHPLPALESANRKFRRRFDALEVLARERGIALPGATLSELDRLWDEVKGREGAPPGGDHPE
jgi:nucleoside triphosphate diphosphatase